MFICDISLCTLRTQFHCQCAPSRTLQGREYRKESDQDDGVEVEREGAADERVELSISRYAAAGRFNQPSSIISVVSTHFSFIPCDAAAGMSNLFESFMHSFIHTFTLYSFLSFIHSFTQSFYPLIHSFLHSFLHSFSHSVIQSFSHSVIQSFVHLFMHSSFIRNIRFCRRRTRTRLSCRSSET
jgi:hypothetical protein